MTKSTFDLKVNDNILQRLTLDNDTGLQNVTISDNQSVFDAPDFSAILDIVTTKAGFAFPSMTTVQMNAVTNPKLGLIVHNIDEDKAFIYTNAHGWFPISGLKMPTTTTPNSIITWNDNLGSSVNDGNVTIDSSGNMTFPANATLDLSVKGTLKADNINAYAIKCQAIVAEDGIDIQQLTTTDFNADHAVVNTLTVNSDFNVSTSTITAAAFALNINGGISTVPAFTVSGSAPTAGVAAFSGIIGTVISTTAVKNNSIISVTRNVGANAPFDVTTIGSLIVGSIIEGVSFTVYSTVANDNGNFNWLIINL